MAISGPCSRSALILDSISAFLSAGSFSIAFKTSPRPLFGSPPAFLISSPYSLKTSSKNTFTAWPKIMGSETFIIVAFICSENSTPFSLASFTCSLRNFKRAFLLIRLASITSPLSRCKLSLSTFLSPLLEVNSIFTSVSSLRVRDFSLALKSPPSIVAT